MLLALWAALALLVRGASKTLTRQTRELRQRSRDLLASYERLEESSLEAIESLNATVEAKDPDTAGHSLRVQRVALAIAAQLELTAQQVDALRFGSLFHDIGKIAVPDGILVKPAKLDYWEYAQMKTHSAEGARIVEQVRPAARGGADHQAPPRALGRHGLSGRARRRCDPARGGDRRARRRLGRDDHRPALPPRADQRRRWPRFAPAAARSSRRSWWTRSSSPRRSCPTSSGSTSRCSAPSE